MFGGLSSVGVVDLRLLVVPLFWAGRPYAGSLPRRTRGWSSYSGA